MMPMALPRKPVKDIADILDSVYERADHVNVKAGAGETLIGKDIKTIIVGLSKMREAAANLEFEEPACAMRLSGWRPKSWDWMPGMPVAAKIFH